jgi:hypothetical protein
MHITGVARGGPRLDHALWFTGALQINPVDQTVLVDTGPLVIPGDFLVAVQGGGSAGYNYDLQLRDTANAVTQALLPRFSTAGPEDLIVAWMVTIVQNERMRCVLQGGITGNVRLALGLQSVL